MKSIGIDIGKRRCIVCTMDRNGTVLEETGYENTYASATAFARKARRKYGKCQAVCESTGNLWIKTYEAFEDRGTPIELANPMKVRAIAEASVKTDKVDARTLAHLLRTSLIARCRVVESGVRGVRQLLRERNNLVKARTQAINRLHNLLDRYDLNPKDSAQDHLEGEGPQGSRFEEFGRSQRRLRAAPVRARHQAPQRGAGPA